jgi:capsular exopolysaccharide synthesis family protein
MTDRLAPDERNSIRYLHAVRTRWRYIVVIVAVAVGAAVLYSALAAKRYKAEADILITPVSSSDDTFIGFSVLRDTGSNTLPILTAARLITTPQVAALAAKRLGMPGEWKAVLHSVSVKPISQSDIAAIVAEAGSADRAAEIANALAYGVVASRKAQFQSELDNSISRLNARLREIPANSPEAAAIQARLATLTSLKGQNDPTIRILSGAVPPDAASWPRPVLSVVVAFVAALLWGIGVAIALELLGSRITSEEELQLRQRLPILARVPRLPTDAVRGYLTHAGPLPASVWESYRTLRASLAIAGKDGAFPDSVLVTSAIAGEGKTMTSVNLAITIAMSGVRVVLVDGDLRRPMVATVFGLPPRRHSFASLLLGTVSPDKALIQAPHHRNLSLLLASPEQAHLVDALAPGRVEHTLRELSELTDVVVIDSPPLTEVADALALADAVDTALIAVRLGHSRRDKLVELRQMLAQQGVAAAGFVVTSRRGPQPSGYYHDRAVELHNVEESAAAGRLKRPIRVRPEVQTPRPEDVTTA